MSKFENLNPITIFVYYSCVIAFSMFVTNPFLLMISLVGAIAFYLTKFNKKEIIKDLRFYILLTILITITNPLISQKGETVLFKVGRYNYTVEALAYGLYISILLITVMIWFKTYNIIMTSEKSMYLFGRFLPKTSIVLSTILRFIPMIREHSRKVKQSQEAMGMYNTDSLKSKIKSSSVVFYSTVSWIFENALDTSSSMNARGYSNRNRTSYSLIKFCIYDAIWIALNLGLLIVCVVGVVKGALDFSYYPTIKTTQITSLSVFSLLSFGVLVFVPTIADVIDNIKWKYHISKSFKDIN